MINIAYLLLVAGFLGGAYVAALDEQQVNWIQFAMAAAAAVRGELMPDRGDQWLILKPLVSSIDA